MASPQEVEKIHKQLEKRHEDWRKVMLQMYSQGASDREVMCELRLSPGAWKALESSPVDSDFGELVELGRLFAHAWWETQGRTNLNNSNFQTMLYKINMANRFGWADKSETSKTNIDLGNIDDESLLRDINQMYQQLNKGRGKGAI